MGEDVELAPLTPIRAIADGEIVSGGPEGSGPHDGYGVAVIIEHALPSGLTFPNGSTKFVSIYGHLSSRSGYTAKLSGSVKQGEVVGYVGYDDENGDGSPHLHLGVRIGEAPRYSSGAPKWVYYGYYNANQTVEKPDYLDNGDPIGGKFTSFTRLLLWWRDQERLGLTNPYSGHPTDNDSHQPRIVFGDRVQPEKLHWYYDPPANPITNEIITSGDAKGMSKNVYVQHYRSEMCGNDSNTNYFGSIVYDALGGARSAYIVGWQQRCGWIGTDNIRRGGWELNGGSRSPTLRNPITNSYWSPSDNCWRQDFQMGWLCYEVWHGYDSGDVAPGVYDPWGNIFSDVRRWDPTTSYAFAEAYERNGAAVNLGSTDSTPNETPFVHNWTVNGATVRIQDYNGGAWGDAALIYNQNTGNAHAILWGFWSYYRANAGPSLLGAPTEEEHADRCPHQSCQAFNNGYLSWEYGYDIFPIYWTAETRAFADAYSRYPKADLGFARDDGGGIFIHDWTMHGYTIRLQNFNNGNWGNNALVYNPAQNKAYSLKWGFWDYYRYNQGPEFLGAPFEDEHPKNIGGCIYEACQKFERGTLAWDYSGAGIRIVSNFY